MTIDAAGVRGERVTLPWRKCPREAVHRTSEPTGDAVEQAISEVKRLTASRRRVTADTVILAALRFAMRTDMDGYADEVAAVEAGTYTVWPPKFKPDPVQ